MTKLPNLLDDMEKTCASAACPSFDASLQTYTLTAGQHVTYESTTQDTLDISRGFTAVVLARPSATGLTADLITLSTGGSSDQIVLSLGSANGGITASCPLGQATVLQDKIWQFSDITTGSAFDAYFSADPLIEKDLSGVLPATYTSASVGYTTHETWKGSAVGYMKFTVPPHYTHALVYTANCHSANTVDILHSTDGESSWTTIGQASGDNQVTACFSVSPGDVIKLQETTADICLSSRVHLTTSLIAAADCNREWSLKRQDFVPNTVSDEDTSVGLGIYALTTSSNGTLLYAPDSNGNFLHAGIVVADCAGFDNPAGAESAPQPDLTKNLARMCGSGNEACTGVSSSQLYGDTDTRTNEANTMDGDLVSRWQNAGQETNAWLRIDLSSTQSVLKVKVTFRSNSDTTLPKDGWKIRLGDNNDQTNAICAGPLTPMTAAENYQAEVTCAGQGRYISIESNSSENIWFSVTEFEIYGPIADSAPEPDMTKNLARMCGDGTQPCTPSAKSEHSTASTLASVTDADTDFLNSAWVAASDGTNSHWVQVDLGASIDVLRLKISFRANSALVLDRANNFEAWIGDTSQTPGSPNVRCYEHAGEAEAAETVDCHGSGRYIILNFFADTVGVAELEVYGPRPTAAPEPDMSLNLARCGAGAGEAGCAASQSSPYNPANPSDTSNVGTDGVNTGYGFVHTQWTDGNGESNPWWRLDFGKTQSVLRVKLWNREDCCWSKLQGFEVWIGDATTYDGSGNTRCSSGVTFEATAAGREIDADCVGSGQYVFVVIPGSNKILHFLEFQVFGPYPPSSFELDTATEADTSLNLARACGVDTLTACTVTAKTSHNAGTVANVNNDDTDWNNGVWYANQDPEYMQIDLGETKNVHNIEIWFSFLSDTVLHRADNFEVWIGDRSALLASPNTKCYEHPGSVNLYQNVNCQGFGRYVIFRFYTPLVAVAEAKIYGPRESRVNLARCGAADGDVGCAVTVSSLCAPCTSAFPSAKVTDGVSTNVRGEGESWVSDDGTSEWLQIDLGETKSVEYIKIWFRDFNPVNSASLIARADDFDVYLCGQKLTDSEAFSMHEEHKCHDFQGTPSPVQVVACNGEGRYLTVRFFNAYVGVGEVKVFGPTAVSNSGILAPGYRVRLGGPESTNTATNGFAGLIGPAFIAARALSRAELGLAIHQLARYEGSVPTGADSRWYTFDGDLNSYATSADLQNTSTSVVPTTEAPFTCDAPVDLTALCRDGTLTCTVSGQALYGCANAPCADGYDTYEYTHLYDNDLATKIHAQSTGGTNANWYGLGFGSDVYVTDVTWSSWQVGMHDRDVGGQIMASGELLAYGSVWATEEARGFAATECGVAFPAKQAGVQNLERSCNAEASAIYVYHAQTHDGSVFSSEMKVMGCVVPAPTDAGTTKLASLKQTKSLRFKTFSSQATHAVINGNLLANERLPTKAELRAHLAEYGSRNPDTDYWVPVWGDDAQTIVDWLNEGGGGAHFAGKSLREPTPDGVGYADGTVNAWTDPKSKYYVIAKDASVDPVYVPAPLGRLYGLEVPPEQTLTTPLAITFDWTKAWTMQAWLQPKQYNWALSSLGATASMSTNLAGSTGLPSDAIDGLTHTAWDGGSNGEDCAISAQNDANPWLMIDLKQTVNVQEVKVYGRSDTTAAPIKPFTIRVGDSPTTTSNAVCFTSTTGLGSAESYQRLVECVGAGRYVSIETAGVDSGHYFSICEFQVFGHAMTLALAESASTNDLQKYCTKSECSATQSSDPYGHAASNGIDGNYCQDMSDYSGAGSWGGAADCNVCTHTGSDANPFWRVDLGSEKQVTRVKVWGRSDAEQDRLDNFKVTISTSDDRTTGTTCATSGSLTPDDYTKDVPCETIGRYVFVHRTDMTGILTVCEVEIYGPTSSPSAVMAVNSVVAMAAVRSYPPNDHLITKETSTSLTYTLSVPTSAAYGAGNYLLSTSGRNLNYDLMPINNLFGKGTATELGTVELSSGVAEASLPYSTSTGLANGNAADLLGTNSYRGDYITVEFPTALYMKSVILMIGNTVGQNGYGRLNYPVRYRVYADDNGSWKLLSEVTNAVYVSSSSTSFERARVIEPTVLQYVSHTVAHVNADTAYSKFAVIFNKIAGTFPGYVQIHGVEFQASEGAQVWRPDTWTHVSLRHTVRDACSSVTSSNLARACAAGDCASTSSGQGTYYTGQDKLTNGVTDSSGVSDGSEQWHEDKDSNNVYTGNSWVQIDLENSRKIGEVRIWFNDYSEHLNAVDNFEIWLSDTPATAGLKSRDAISGTAVKCYTDDIEGSPAVHNTVKCCGSGRYVIVFFPNPKGTLFEVEVYGSSSTSTQVFIDGSASPDATVDTTALTQGGNLEFNGGVVDDVRVFFEQVQAPEHQGN